MSREQGNIVEKNGMKDLDMAGRYEAMLSLGREGRLHKEVLERLCIQDDEPFIRKRALRMLAARKDKGYLDVLHQAMGDPDPMVRTVAAEQLFYCAREGENVRLGDSLKPLLYDSDVGVRTRAISLLVMSGEKGTAELVLNVFFHALERGKGQEEINQIASLMSLLKGRKVEKLLRKRLESLDDERRRTGVGALQHEGIEIT